MVDYAILVGPLSEDDGGGYLARFPDLPGCQSDGDTPAEAVKNALDAFNCWMEAQKERGAEIPQPGSAHAELSVRIRELRSIIAEQAQEIESLKAEVKRLSQQKQPSKERWVSRRYGTEGRLDTASLTG